jgi:serine/threonine protein kinase
MPVHAYFQRVTDHTFCPCSCSQRLRAQHEHSTIPDEPFMPGPALQYTAACILHVILHAHQQGYVLRDIKPDNIMLRANGQPALIDFGLATKLDPNGLAYGYAGSPLYMAPEAKACNRTEEPYTAKVDNRHPQHLHAVSAGARALPLAPGVRLHWQRWVLRFPVERFAC